MQLRSRWALPLGLAMVLGWAPLPGMAVSPKDNEAALAAKLGRESNPVNKAKIEIRLSGLKLQFAKDARDRNQVEESLKQLQEYHLHIVSAWDLLQKSGRVPQAHKKPQGFKELDIALRQDLRFLEDLKRAYSMADREPIEKIIADAGRIRKEVLKALFPAEDGAGR